MNLKSVLAFTKPVTGFIKDHRRGIITAVNIGATLYAVYRAAKDGPKFKEIIDTMPEDATTWDKVKELAPAVAPTVAATLVSVGSAGLMYKDCSDTIRGLADAYTIASLAKDEFEEHAEKVVGKEKVQEIKKSIAKENAPKFSPEGQALMKIVETGKGTDLIYDKRSDTWFRGDINYINNVGVNIKNRVINADECVMTNEFYHDIGLGPFLNERNMGWHPAHYRSSDDMFVQFYGDITDDNRPYAIMYFSSEPGYVAKPNSAWG